MLTLTSSRQLAFWQRLKLSIVLLLVSPYFFACGVPHKRRANQWPSIPARPSEAVSGSKFMALTAAMPLSERETVIQQQVRQGNVPLFLRTMIPLTFRQTLADSRVYKVTLMVSADYLAIGSSNDFVRVPVNLYSALQIADDLGLQVPTKKIVDMVYRHANVHMQPQPLPAGSLMVTSGYIAAHDEMIDEQDGQRRTSGRLVAGHKKDIILTPKLLNGPERLAIYGWHQLTGRAIQPLSMVHEADYADYSHGLRLIGSFVWINGKKMSVAAVLADPKLAPLLSDEGPIAVDEIKARYLQTRYGQTQGQTPGKPHGQMHGRASRASSSSERS